MGILHIASCSPLARRVGALCRRIFPIGESPTIANRLQMSLVAALIATPLVIVFVGSAPDPIQPVYAYGPPATIANTAASGTPMAVFATSSPTAIPSPTTEPGPSPTLSPTLGPAPSMSPGLKSFTDTVANAQAYSRLQIGASQSDCLWAIARTESRWRVTVRNHNSGAYGLWQALPASKMAAYGADYRTSALTQTKWAIAYAKRRYGSACEARAFQLSHGWW